MAPSPLQLWFPGLTEPAPGLPAVLCLAGAGGGPSEFHAWSALLHGRLQVAAVALPGRERRASEPPSMPLPTLVRQLTHAARPLTSRPFALFGYSLGALIMYEFARALPVGARQNLRRLFVGGQPGPSLPQLDSHYSQRSDAGLIGYLRRLGGTPAEVLDSQPLMRHYLPYLRADLRLAEQYHYSGEAALQCPITAFHGRKDTEVTVAAVRSWGRETTSSFQIVELTGGHFSVRTDREAIAAEICRSMTPCCFAPARQS